MTDRFRNDIPTCCHPVQRYREIQTLTSTDDPGTCVSEQRLLGWDLHGTMQADKPPSDSEVFVVSGRSRLVGV